MTKNEIEYENNLLTRFKYIKAVSLKVLHAV